ncbi:MAG: L,D-transpeptidase [Gammaproteobacteria bacterium]|nr:L,D-transpeptidase [Gammaproteobacteria bacterium]
MKPSYCSIIYFSLCFGAYDAQAKQRFGEQLCQQADYHCEITKLGETWESLFPDSSKRDLVQRINRMNIELLPGMQIAVPNQLEQLNIYDISPFPRFISSTGEKSIYVDQQKLAWAAYNDQGELIWWGPASGGSGHCNSNTQGDCKTPSGSFRVVRKNDETCISTVFPMRGDGESGGAIMPYCMHFWRGYALHGSEEVPGYAASHGCVRLFVQDARWLNEQFIDLPGAGGKIGTKVIVN